MNSTPTARARQKRRKKAARPEPYASEGTPSLGRNRRKTPNSTYAAALMWRQAIVRVVRSFIMLPGGPTSRLRQAGAKGFDCKQ
jgi:hypothetical protein